MKPSKRIEDTALILPVCGTVLFLPPYIQIFDQELEIAGIPFLYVALFSIWVIGILLTAIVSRRLSRESGATGMDPEIPAQNELIHTAKQLREATRD